MKALIYRILIFSLLIGFVVSCGDDDKSSTEPEGGIDPALIGSWQLTQILSPIITTPETIGLAITAVFTEDGNVTFTTTDIEGTEIDNGTWSTSNGKITIKLEGADAATSPYSINGNVASITAYPIDYQGTSILASLEFTKI